MSNALPIPPLPNTRAVPEELRVRPQWVVWKYEIRDGRPTKVPLQATSSGADSTNPQHWTTYDKAYRNAEANRRGVGYVFSPDDPYTGIDLDHCREPQSGDIELWAQKIINSLNSYAEVSPSQTGVKIIVKAALPDYMGSGGKTYLDASKTRAIEIYHHSRFFTITGATL